MLLYIMNIANFQYSIIINDKTLNKILSQRRFQFNEKTFERKKKYLHGQVALQLYELLHDYQTKNIYLNIFKIQIISVKKRNNKLFVAQQIPINDPNVLKGKVDYFIETQSEDLNVYVNIKQIQY